MKNQWVVKKKAIYLIARIIMKTMNNNLWYLDSNCSRHMLRDKSQLKKFESLSRGSMTYEDGSTTTIEGK